MRIKVGTKISLGFVVMIFFIVILGVYSYYSLKTIIEKSTNIDKSNQKVVLAMQIENELKNSVAGIRGFVAYGDEKFFKQLEEAMGTTLKLENQLLQVVDEGEKSEIKELIQKTTQYSDGLINELSPVVRVMHREESAGNIARAQELKKQTLTIAGKLIPFTEEISKTVNNLVKINEEVLKGSLMASRDNADRINNMSLFLNVSSVIIGIFLSFYLTRIIRNPILQMVEGANRYTEGDFRAAIGVNSQDELGELATSLNKMQINFREVIQKIQNSAGQLNDAASELVVQSQQTSEGATSTATTMNEIASTVENMAEDTQEVSQRAHIASQHADKGYHGLEMVTNQMQEIASSTGQVSISINDLSSAINKIGQFVEVITNIADQTNLLALNAAIEAARAGEAGRGFAVVADEVRKLAEQSAQSTKEIKQLIIDINTQANLSLQAMVVSSDKVNQGSQIVEEVGQNFNEIINVVQELSGQVQSVAAAAQQVSAGVQNVAATTEEQTAAMEEVNSSTEALTVLAIELRGMADRFKI